MASAIQLKRSSTAGNKPSSLAAGELAVNIPDRLAFIADGSGTVQTVNLTSDAEKVASGAIATAITGVTPIEKYAQGDNLQTDCGPALLRAFAALGPGGSVSFSGRYRLATPVPNLVDFTLVARSARAYGPSPTENILLRSGLIIVALSAFAPSNGTPTAPAFPTIGRGVTIRGLTFVLEGLSIPYATPTAANNGIASYKGTLLGTTSSDFLGEDCLFVGFARVNDGYLAGNGRIDFKRCYADCTNGFRIYGSLDNNRPECNHAWPFTTVAVQVNSTGTTTSGSTSVTAVTNAGSLYAGMVVSGSGIPAGATIASVSGSTVTLSVAATASASGVALTFQDLNNLLRSGIAFEYYGRADGTVSAQDLNFGYAVGIKATDCPGIRINLGWMDHGNPTVSGQAGVWLTGDCGGAEITSTVSVACYDTLIIDVGTGAGTFGNGTSATASGLPVRVIGGTFNGSNSGIKHLSGELVVIGANFDGGSSIIVNDNIRALEVGFCTFARGGGIQYTSEITARSKIRAVANTYVTTPRFKYEDIATGAIGWQGAAIATNYNASDANNQEFAIYPNTDGSISILGYFSNRTGSIELVRFRRSGGTALSPMFFGLPDYSSDQAAASDPNLPSGGSYRISGDEALRVKR